MCNLLILTTRGVLRLVFIHKFGYFQTPVGTDTSGYLFAALGLKLGYLKLKCSDTDG